MAFPVNLPTGALIPGGARRAVGYHGGYVFVVGAHNNGSTVETSVFYTNGARDVTGNWQRIGLGPTAPVGEYVFPRASRAYFDYPNSKLYVATKVPYDSNLDNILVACVDLNTRTVLWSQENCSSGDRPYSSATDFDMSVVSGAPSVFYYTQGLGATLSATRSGGVWGLGATWRGCAGLTTLAKAPSGNSEVGMGTRIDPLIARAGNLPYGTNIAPPWMPIDPYVQTYFSTGRMIAMHGSYDTTAGSAAFIGGSGLYIASWTDPAVNASHTLETIASGVDTNSVQSYVNLGDKRLVAWRSGSAPYRWKYRIKDGAGAWSATADGPSDLDLQNTYWGLVDDGTGKIVAAVVTATTYREVDVGFGGGGGGTNAAVGHSSASLPMRGGTHTLLVERSAEVGAGAGSIKTNGGTHDVRIVNFDQTASAGGGSVAASGPSTTQIAVRNAAVAAGGASIVTAGGVHEPIAGSAVVVHSPHSLPMRGGIHDIIAIKNNSVGAGAGSLPITGGAHTGGYVPFISYIVMPTTVRQGMITPNPLTAPVDERLPVLT